MRIGNVKNPKFESSEAKRVALLKYSEEVLRGTSPQRIYEMLHDEFEFDTNQSLHFYNEVKDTIAESVVENNYLVVENHLELYEDVFRRCLAIDDAKGMMKAMKQKEELLKIYDNETTEVVVNKQTNIFNQPTYQPEEKLDPAQQNRLLELLYKATQG